MDKNNRFIERVDICVAANERRTELRNIAVNKMRGEVADFLRECMEEAKQFGYAAMLYKGKEFEIDMFFNTHNNGYCFPEELKKEIEEAGYFFTRIGDSKNYKVWG